MRWVPTFAVGLIVMTVAALGASAHPFPYPPYAIEIPGGHLDPSGATLQAVEPLANPVGFFVCQDTNGDLLCGSDGEPSIVVCGSAEIATGLPPFSPNAPLLVFIDSLPLGILSACGFGTVGELQHS